MVKLTLSLIWPGCAEGKYSVKAKGFILAVLRWGNAEAPLTAWSPFAYVPIDPAGNGCFAFSGKRGIPPGATHVWACCYAADFASSEQIAAVIPSEYLAVKPSTGDAKHFSVFTDLHLSAKPWKIKQALRAAESDTLLLLGDSTNDGLPEQFDAFRACIEQTAFEKTIFPVTGNHDVLRPSKEKQEDGCKHYAAFQSDLLARAREKGLAIEYAPDGRAYSVQMDDLDLIALQCVTTGRKFRFPDGVQIDWLEEHLSHTEAAWHVILCHAPTLKHNPNRTMGMPYLDQNKRLQELLDRTGRILFLNGHTHVSPNVLYGNGEWDAKHQNVYLDCGSVVATDTSGETGLMSPDWKDGCRTELAIAKDWVEICMSSIESGVKFSRGYYLFHRSAESARSGSPV